MSVRSKQLAVGRFGLNNTNQLLYTVQSGETTIVKNLVLYNRHTGSQRFRLVLDPTGAVASTTIAEWTLATQSWVNWDTWMVLNPGDSLLLRVDNATPDLAFLVLSGAELEGQAD